MADKNNKTIPYPDTGKYDEAEEGTRRALAVEMSEYAESGDRFDPKGDYLCKDCSQMDLPAACGTVSGLISDNTGSCRYWLKDIPLVQLEEKFTPEEASYTERPNWKEFGCKKCLFGTEAKAPDSEGRPSWCSWWGIHVLPNACCAKNEGDDDFQPQEENKKQAREGYDENGHWVGQGGAASGILPVCSTTKRICLARRSSEVETGNCWGTIGGAVKEGLDPASSAKAELAEETGYAGALRLIPAHVFIDGKFKYHNFIGIVSHEFSYAPKSGHDWETDSLTWVSWEELEEDISNNPSDYHPGLLELLQSSADVIEGALGMQKTSAERGIWYHGSPIKNLRSILAEGLIPYPKSREWADDPGASMVAPSRESYGGIYVAKNLLTAVSAPREKHKEGRMVLVIMELQPSTFYMDEDSIVGSVGAPLQHISDSSYHVANAYIAATQPGVSASWKSWVEEYQKQYLKHSMANFEYKFKEQEKEIHPDLRNRLEVLIKATWLPALSRLAAHAAEKMSDYDYKRSYTEVFPKTWDEVPPKDQVFPSVSQGETDFRNQVEKITRTVRQLIAKTPGFRNTARVTTPIGYSGSNRILAVLEIREGKQYTTKAEPDANGYQSDIIPIIIHYGKVPEDFWNQWKQSLGYKTTVTQAKQSASKWLYHVTFSGYLESISQHGLVPNSEPGITGGGEKGKVFVTEADGIAHWLERAENWAYYRSDNPAEEGLVPCVIRFPRRDVKNIAEDEVAVRENTFGAYKADGVAPDHIELWSGKKWGGLWMDVTVPVADDEGYLLDGPVQKPKLSSKGGVESSRLLKHRTAAKQEIDDSGWLTTDGIFHPNGHLEHSAAAVKLGLGKFGEALAMGNIRIGWGPRFVHIEGDYNDEASRELIFSALPLLQNHDPLIAIDLAGMYEEDMSLKTAEEWLRMGAKPRSKVRQSHQSAVNPAAKFDFKSSLLRDRHEK
jgi:8-oxo-dGTP pyrophosphatase MutT (NUDIX family)